MSSSAVAIYPERRLTKPLGRPVTRPYDPEIAEDICEAIATTALGLRDICASNSAWPSEATVRNWLRNNDEFAERYAQARQFQVHLLVDETIEIADNANADAYVYFDRHGKPHARINGEAVQRSKVKIDARQWAAAKLLPHVYGDKLDVTSGGEPLPPPSPLVIDARVQTIMLAAARVRDSAKLLDD